MTSPSVKTVSANKVIERLVEDRQEKAKELGLKRADRTEEGTSEKKDSSALATPSFQDEEMESPRNKMIEKMPLELQILLQKENDDKIYSLMGFSKVDYLKYLQECKYLRSHGLKTQLQENIYKNADISKKFFNIIDQNNEGGISDKEFANPLISLGLATDPGFVRKVMRILAPKKFKSFQDYKEEELTLKEFANLFKSDPIGDRLVKALRDEIIQTRQAKAEKIRKRQILQRRTERLAKEGCDFDRVNINLNHL